MGFKLATPLCEKYNINPDEIKTLEDLEAAFAIIKENEPDITVIMPETTGQGIAGSVYGDHDQLCTGGGMLGGEDGSFEGHQSDRGSGFY